MILKFGIIKIKRFLKRILQILPDEFLIYIAKIFINSLKEDKPFVNKISLFEFKELTYLSNKDNFLDFYRSKLDMSGNSSSDNIYKLLRYNNLSSALEFVLRTKVEGDISECGCWHGHSLFMLKELVDKYKSNKKIYVFDSFEGGLSDFKSTDLENSSINLKESKLLSKQYFSDYSLLEDKIKIKGLKDIILNRGWIPSVFEQTEKRVYSFVHIDVDLYEPTLDCLKYFYGKVSRGGILICDDYGYNLFPGAKRAVDQFISGLDKNDYSLFLPFSVGGCLIQK